LSSESNGRLQPAGHDDGFIGRSGPREVEVFGRVHARREALACLELVGDDRAGADDQQGVSEESAPIRLAKDSRGSRRDRRQPQRSIHRARNLQLIALCPYALFSGKPAKLEFRQLPLGYRGARPE
jgi:hypothetical protein